MEKNKNIKVISAPMFVMGLPIIAWFVCGVISALTLNVLAFFLLPIIAFISASAVFFILFLFFVIKTRGEPDYTTIMYTKIFKIRMTKNKDYKGNCYVA